MACLSPNAKRFMQRHDLKLERSPASSPVDLIDVVPFYSKVRPGPAPPTQHISSKLKGLLVVYGAAKLAGELLEATSHPLLQSFELYTEGGCNSITCPETVLDGTGDQRASFTVPLARLVSAKKSRRTLKIQWKNQVELHNFLTVSVSRLLQ